LPVIQDVARASLYRGKINLWVEDELTRAYLSAIWNNPDVAFFIGGGNEGVRAIVIDAEKAGFSNVFALIDRDFKETNKLGWMDPSKTFRTFVLSVHEIENHLLDAAALSASRFNNLSKTEAEIDTIMKEKAMQLCWWAACRDVVAELRTRFCNGFLSHPNQDVDCEAKAQKHICESLWYQKLRQEVDRSTIPDVHKLLANAHIIANQCLSDGKWRTEFAGKEILRDIGSRICDHTKFKSSGSERSTAAFNEDLAKEVGAWQRVNDKVPADLIDLLTALQTRIARPSAS
jgi:hypothetical protein